MIYIVALGIGFKYPRKIHLNTQWGGGPKNLEMCLRNMCMNGLFGQIFLTVAQNNFRNKIPLLSEYLPNMSRCLQDVVTYEAWGFASRAEPTASRYSA